MITQTQILCGCVTRLEQLIKIRCSCYAKTCYTISLWLPSLLQSIWKSVH